MPKQRPRFTADRRGRVHTYTPLDAKEYEQAVGRAAKAAGIRRIERDLLAVRIVLYLRPMRRWPDLDNCAKSILDGLSGIAWVDDRQVRELHVYERRVQKPAEERAEIVIRPLRRAA